MSTAKKVSIVGPGFTGWNVLELLVREGNTGTELVPRDEHAKHVEKSGASALKSDLDDHDLIVKHVPEHEIIIHTATADHLPSVQAVLGGVKQRAAASKPAVFIHTSGTFVLDDTSWDSSEEDRKELFGENMGAESGLNSRSQAVRLRE